MSDLSSACRQSSLGRTGCHPPSSENAEKLPALGLWEAWEECWPGWAMPGLEASPGSAAPPTSLRAALKAATCLTRILRDKN